MRVQRTRVGAAVAVLWLAAGAAAESGKQGLKLSSPAFRNGLPIPKLYSCDGSNVSPALRWSVPPRRTRSFALIVDDPDAPGRTFVHWVAWNIRAQLRTLPRGKHPPREGVNDTGRRGYTGPCPPAGSVHHYVFRLYALNTLLILRPNTSATALKSTIRGRVLATAKLVGTYKR